jgi:hypothetical protein
MALRSEREKYCEMRLVESTELSQRLIYGEVRTKASKEAVWRIRASTCHASSLVSQF